MRARLTSDYWQGPCWLHSRAGNHGALSPERRPAKAPAGAVERPSKSGWAAVGRALVQAGPSASTRIGGGISASKRAREAQGCKRVKADRWKKARGKGSRPYAQASLLRWSTTRCSWARSNAFSPVLTVHSSPHPHRVHLLTRPRYLCACAPIMCAR